MNLNNRAVIIGATLVLGSSLLAGCSSSKQASNAEVAAPGDAGKVVSFDGCEPQTKFLPGLVNETCGVNVMEMFAGRLMAYDKEGKAFNELAESITTDDNQHWTIKVKPGKKFSDGTPINADSFVNAWNLVVREQQEQAFFFEDIAGYELGKDLAGLKKVDDLTFTVELAQPESDWTQRLGYIAYSPLPEVAFKDLEAFGEKPVSSGPYVLTEWEHRKSIKLKVNDQYDGPRKAKNGGLEDKMYTSPETAYNDLLAGNLDVLSNIPDSALKTFKDDLNGRGISKSLAGVVSIGIPMNAPHFQGEEGRLRRAAISMAIDRPEVIKAIFNNTKQPAEDFTSPAVDGWKSGLKGSEVLQFNPEKAKELWAQAEAISKFEGPFKFAYNTAGGHQAWVDAVCNQIKNNLGIPAEGDAYPDFKSVQEKIANGEMKTAFRANWTADYPSQYNFLGPVYASKAESNRVGYANEKFDQLLKEGLVAKDAAGSAAKYAEAQELLLADLPAIPLWYGSINAGYSDQVQNVTYGWDDVPKLYDVVKP
ncbi:hypothetical protein BSR29_05880 [Boudabousia liubingyangii]|uniref:Solute-binding protein family 5 domain-containing protein n=1 Tax=Boudabousia liubingyangii TaxID=1921764 RepID=A0A1Q5PLR4_9ACTO|nr:ABC transporter substrate-binding protein [Boudabousia liubingyangii]OKL46885.1 hypothetical protein BSR28_05520 [Boudabousia liubingyangii]OKL48005.1 hypothetical protein BSR29_05880 [Boudabousia liubingyangii]